VVECLANKHKALSSSTSTIRKKEKERGKKEGRKEGREEKEGRNKISKQYLAAPSR
jgi:hypothetical protein